MSATTLSQNTHYIHFILPLIKIYYKLDTLLASISTTNNNEQQLIFIAVEHNNRKRHFLSVTFDELSKLLHCLEPPKLTLYEILCRNNSCKLYFDVDVYIENTFLINIQESLSTLQNLFHYIISNCTDSITYHSASIADHFLVLSASTELKHSYHLIYTNTIVRFDSQQTVLKFILTILQYCTHFILSHSCHQHFLQSISIHHENNPNNWLKHLQTILTNTNFCNCVIPATNITCNNFQKLLFKNSNGFYQWIFDLHVYNKNQQFRLYKATKFGKHNPLLTTSSFSFNGQNERKNEMLIDKTINYDSILSHALISYTVNNTNLLIFSFNENKWSLLDQHENRIVDLTTKTYFTTLIISKTSPNETNALKRIPPTNTTDLANNTDHFKSFITNLITKIYHTNAYIRSCQRGTNNPSLLFYNIGGEFRFCERLQRHHQSNNTCIIVDTSTCKYQIKCKDPDCKNFKPPWKHIS
ncbi:unnamed protein product [Rotaria socialis]|uniref:DNA-directed primase/polymerase protein n=1 Tax=Rotaria socialis TaxID=392032 RepID=A0A818N537_9BILA|nr:unnamed protein product [Rotaria socialis]CAF3599993.1 unnamed protein product [Rotaria socialis]